MANTPPTQWPKVLPPLTVEQQQISDEFCKLWHEELPQRYGIVERFNHRFPVTHSRPGFVSTLEIGAGLAEHLEYEVLTPEQRRNYHCNELRPVMAEEIRKRFPEVQTVIGDCQERMEFADHSIDRVLAIHVLEHLPNLPAAIAEVHRLLASDGQLLVVIPTEGGLAYSLARKISAERLYKRRFGGDYSWFYKREHINMPAEIIDELGRWFSIEERSYFPLKVPSINVNLCIGLSLQPRPDGAASTSP
ncbi:MAG: methyltransferase domain-containing protein [Acidimicrobiales bacterium]